MRKLVLAAFVLLGFASVSEAQTPFYARGFQTGPYSGYFYVGPGTQWYYNQGVVYPGGYYQQGMNVYGIRVDPYGSYASQVNFNSLQMLSVQRRLALRRFYYGY